MNLLLRFWIVILVFAMQGCGTSRPHDAQGFREITTHKAGSAVLYIFRPEHEIGSAVWPEVFINEQKVVGLKNGGYTTVFIKPGKYHIRTEKSSFLSGMENIPGEFEIADEGKYFLIFDRSYNQFTSFNGLHSSPSFSANYERWILAPEKDVLPAIRGSYYIQPYVEAIPR